LSFIYILSTPEVYAQAQASGSYRSESLELEGFIHASPAHQLTRVANKYYAQHPELLVLTLDPARISVELKWVAISTGDSYPHLYGALNLDAIIAVETVARMPDGNYEIYVTD
jgi:uncharacterized protein (DUF952 family)